MRQLQKKCELSHAVKQPQNITLNQKKEQNFVKIYI